MTSESASAHLPSVRSIPSLLFGTLSVPGRGIVSHEIRKAATVTVRYRQLEDNVPVQFRQNGYPDRNLHSGSVRGRRARGDKRGSTGRKANALITTGRLASRSPMMRKYILEECPKGLRDRVLQERAYLRMIADCVGAACSRCNDFESVENQYC